MAPSNTTPALRWDFADLKAAQRPVAPLSAPIVENESTTNPSNSKQVIFATEEIKGRQDVFIAGRGGEAIFHAGNVAFRQRVLQHTETYAGLRTCERGRKFARQLWDQYFLDVTFVVRHSYFFKNLQKGTISKEKIESVRQEHGGSFNALKEIPSDHYFTVGETWVLGIISDIVRFGGKKSAPTAKNNKTKPRRKSTSSLATVSDDDESMASKGQRGDKKKRAQRRHTAPSSSSVTTGLPLLVNAGAKGAWEGVSPFVVPSLVDMEGLTDQFAGLDALVKMPLPSAEEEASMFTDEEMDLDLLGGVVPL